MDGPPIPADDERELRELRARAYGRDADLFDDPVGLARLAELENRRAAQATAARIDGEAASRAEAEVPPDAALPPDAAPSATGRPSAASGWRRVVSERSREIWLGAGAGVVVVAIGWGVAWLGEPRPTATLSSTAGRADEEVLALVAEPAGWFDIDTTRLRAYETYRGVEPWSARDEFGNPCLLLIDRAADEVLEAACTPQEVRLIADIGAWPADVSDYAFAEGLPDGTVIRFQHRGDTVDVSLIIAPGGD